VLKRQAGFSQTLLPQQPKGLNWGLVH